MKRKTLFFIFMLIVAISTNAISQDAINLLKTDTPRIDSTFSNFLNNMLTPVGFTIGSFLSALLVFIYEELISKRNLIKKIRKQYTNPTPLKPSQKRNSILLIGLGGTGKTTLIRNLLLVNCADPKLKTDNCDIYSGERSAYRKATNSKRESDDQNEDSYLFHITDYKGQNIGTLVRGFLELQNKPNSPIKLNHVNSLILMVDIFRPGSSHDDPDSRKIQDKPDITRIEEHLQQWSDVALDAVFGFLEKKSLKFVCLFINKQDLLSPNYKLSIEKDFEPLINKLREKTRNATEVKILIGSAEKADRIFELENHLRETSVNERESNG